MNERIRLLAIEARLITVDGITRYALDHEFEQRFAELIVRECAKEADKQNIFCRGVPWGNWVKKHFGVEE
jgi:hypothetical protein